MKLLLIHFNLKDGNMAYYMYHVPTGASLIAQLVKNLPAMQETQVQSLGWENPLEEGMATHSSILAWRIPWTEETDGLKSMGLQRDTTEATEYARIHAN